MSPLLVQCSRTLDPSSFRSEILMERTLSSSFFHFSKKATFPLFLSISFDVHIFDETREVNIQNFS